MTSIKICKSKINRGNAGFLIGAIILLFSSFLAIIFVRKQFAGYDLSPIIDLSWRLANSQTPGADFINTMPPLFIVFIKFISWGNLRWIDLTIINIIATNGTFLFLYLVSDHRKESVWWGLFIAIILAIPLLYTNHIWHSSLAQLSGIIFFYSVYVAINSNHPSPKIILSLLLASGFLAISKQNVALPMMLTVVVFLLFLKRQDKLILISFIFLGAISGVVLSMVYLGYSLDSFIYTYSAVLGRTKVPLWLLKVAVSIKSHFPLALLMLSMGSLFLYSVYKRDNKITNMNKFYFLMILAVSLIPIVTDRDFKFNNISLPLFVFTTGIFSSIKMPADNATSQQDHQSHAPEILTAFVILVMIYFLSFINGYMREGMIFRGQNSFYDVDANVVIDQGYFSGLRTGNRLSMVLKEIASAKKEFSHHKIFFGPRIEFGYLYTKSPSPLEMPLWWHPGTSYHVIDEKKITDTFIRTKFDVLIFLKVEKFKMPTDIINYIADNYWLDDKYQHIDLYLYKKTNPNATLAYYDKGNAYAKLGRYKQAIECYNQAILINPDYTEAHYIRGVAYLESGQYQKAIQDFNETIRIHPYYIHAYYNRGIVYSKIGQYQQAIKNYSEVIRLKPDHADAYNNRGAVFLTLGNHIRGCFDAKRACELGNCKILKIAKSNGACH